MTLRRRQARTWKDSAVAATYSHKQRETNIYQSRIVDAEEILLLHSPQGTASARLAITKDLETLNLVPQIAKKKSTALDE